MTESAEEKTAEENTAEEKPAKSLEEMSRDELYELAQELEIPGRSNLRSDKDLLFEAVKNEMAAREAAKTAEAAEGVPVEELPDDEPPEPDPDVPLTADQLRRIQHATSESLEELLEDDTLPNNVRAEVEKELAWRQKRADEEQRRKSLQVAEVEGYRVVKGGRFVKDSHVTQLRTGAFVTPLTHDLKEVRRQGIKIEPCVGFETLEGQLGEKRVRPVGVSQLGDNEDDDD